jgi:hypothetical protein
MDRRHSIRVRLAIPAGRYLAYYRFDANEVIAQTTDGRTIQFPAGALRRFVTHDGVHGLFEVNFNANFKLISVERIGD